VTTLADLLRRRYGAGVERLAALLLIPASLLWAAAQVRAFGQVLSASSALSVDAAIGIAAVVAVVYTVAGGLLADVYTDIVQAGALVLGLAVVLWSAVANAGGPAVASRLIEAAAARPDLPPVGWLATVEAWAIPLCGSVLAQEVVSRSLAARSAAVARGAMLWGGGAYLLVGLVPVALGLLAADLLPGVDREQLLPGLARLHLSDLGYVVFAGALVSAILSTVDSALLAAASFLSRNLLLAGRTDVPERRRLAVARGGVVAFGALAWLLAVSAEGVFALVEEASGFGSAGILVAVCAALLRAPGGASAASLALVAGMLAWIVGAYVMDGATAPYLVSLACALLGYVLGCLVGARLPPRATQAGPPETRRLSREVA
jgi:Na+/proline symporter